MRTQVYTFLVTGPYAVGMAQIGVRELRSALATYLRRAQVGERVVVTVDGAPIAELGPIQTSTLDVTLDDLVARGVVHPPRRRGDFVPHEPSLLYSGVRIDKAVSEIRK